MTEPKTRDETKWKAVNEFSQRTGGWAAETDAFSLGWDAHAAIAKEREKRLWEMLERAKDIDHMDGAEKDAWLSDLESLRKEPGLSG